MFVTGMLFVSCAQDGIFMVKKLVFRITIYGVLTLLVGLAVVPLAGLAQAELTCPDLAQLAVEELEANCNGLGRNSVCYGYGGVTTTFEGETEDVLDEPSSHTPITHLSILETDAMDVADENWGLAVMNVQADVPDALPGNGLTFVVLGDVELYNEVAPDEILPPVTPVSIKTRAAANLRSAPGTNTDVLASVRAGTELTADSLSDGRNWLRVTFNNRTLWVSRDAVDASGDLDTLPIISNRSRTALHAFSFHTGQDAPLCAEAPSLILLQAPENAQANIRANGADITLDSTVVLRLTSERRMELVVLQGSARVGNITVPAGFKVIAPLNSDGEISGSWSGFSPIGQRDRGNFEILQTIPADLLHNSVVLPSESDVQAMLQEFGGTSQPGQGSTVGTSSNDTDCTDFRLTAPLQGLPASGSVNFTWDPAVGATNYEVDIFNESGTQVGTFTASKATTHVTGDISSLGAGTFFTVQVTALVNETPACTTLPVSIPRQAVCNLNDKCEPWLGENTATCGDCSDSGD